jgi:hypothetical protein
MAAAATAPESVETLMDGIGRLVIERQVLRRQRSDRVSLERNRVEIARLQRQLSDALIARFLPAAA